MAGSEPYGLRRAINELKAIFSCQWSNGMLPQIRFVPGQSGYRPDAGDWGVTPEMSGPTDLRTSGITQPPIVALCAAEVYAKSGEAARQAHRADFLAFVGGLERYHSWLLRERDPYAEQLLVCLHPWETGTDNSPAFDPLIDSTRAFVEATGLKVDVFGRADTRHVGRDQRPTDRDYFAYFGLIALFKSCGYDQAAIIRETPFLLQDVLFNSIFVASLKSLAALEETLAAGAAANGNEGAELLALASRNRDRASAVGAAIRTKLWSERDGFFYSYDLRGERLLETRTVSGFGPLLGGVAATEEANRLLEHLASPVEFATGIPLPSTSVASPLFDPRRYWSGPSWPVTNWLVLLGLRERRLDAAEELRQSSLSMIAEGAGADRAREAAVQILERHSFGEEFTTPSGRQYKHAWLWDSAIVAASWPLVKEKPSAEGPRVGDPGFAEYYEPYTGEPLGAAPMTWTASLYLELLDGLAPQTTAMQTAAGPETS